MGQPVSAGSAYGLRLFATLACDMTSASEVAVAAWGALQVLYAFAFALMLNARSIEDSIACLESWQNCFRKC